MSTTKSTSKTAAKKTAAPQAPITAAKMKDKIVHHLRTTMGTEENKANNQAWWKATCAAVNEFVFEGVTSTQQSHAGKDTRAVHYLSAEFLMGRLMSNNMHNLDLFKVTKEALGKLDKDIYDLIDEEPDMALGNGGLGRLAACFIDSLATLNYPALGYGIHYEHGLFHQDLKDGRQIERPDSWREYGNPWEICRPESAQDIKLYGYVETREENGEVKKVWHPGRVIKAVPWDIPVVGYHGKTVNVLRLWESRASDFFNWDVFNSGGYLDSQKEQVETETISKVLYPNDETQSGKDLRLIQQYFFSAASIADIMRRYKRAHGDDMSKLTKQIVIQLNDTHPTVAVPEFMRVLLDEEGLGWDEAWEISRNVFAYTNHTLLPEALEKWPLAMFERILPRHLEIIFEINHRFLTEEVEKKWPGNDEIKRKLSIVEEGGERMIRMGNLAVIGSYKVNGVAQIHSDLVKSDLFPEYDELWPGKFTNVTNGITPRRWLKACNEGLSALIDTKVSDDWALNLDSLQELKKYADDAKFQKDYMQVKADNKVAFAAEIKKLTGIEVDPTSIFDVQIKRLHEYKRQQLNLLHIMGLYKRLLDNPDLDMVPRTFIFGAKAAPGYKLAKDIIYAINRVADKVNNDPRIQNKLKVVFVPNYRVSIAEKLIPAADVSEQISTAGYEASGTGNMKMALNGALTMGTLDGANIEIAEEAGEENVFIFGMNVDEVKARKAAGYNPWEYYHSNEEIRTVLDWLQSDFFTPGHPGELASIRHSLLEGGDPYLTLADYDSYSEAHKAVDVKYRDKAAWARSAIINSATMGKFNSDRSMEDYARDIWYLEKAK